MQVAQVAQVAQAVQVVKWYVVAIAAGAIPSKILPSPTQPCKRAEGVWEFDVNVCSPVRSGSVAFWTLIPTIRRQV